MKATDIKNVRRALDMSARDLADALRMGANGDREVRRWEDGEKPVSGPASVAIEALLTGWRPAP